MYKEGEPKDLQKLKEEIKRLVEERKVRVRWRHIRAFHPEITQADINEGLIYGWYKANGKHPGRYLSWVLARGRLVRVVFELKEGFVVVVSAFEEE